MFSSVYTRHLSVENESRPWIGLSKTALPANSRYSVSMYSIESAITFEYLAKWEVGFP